MPTSTIARPAAMLSKSTEAANINISSTMPTGNSVKMTVDTNGASHIMSLLTDLYSDPALAVLREYSTNALDSHSAAGQAAPIEIHLPSELEPVFVVQDYGVGMSADDINNIYSRYGASTKRSDMSQVGAFGLGCKSALTLTQQFTLVSVKDGVRNVVLIGRGRDGVGEVTILSSTPTDESNGVTVTVPVPSASLFNKNVADFFSTWPVGSVLVDDVAPKSIHDSRHISVTDDVFIARPNLTNGYSQRSTKGFKVIIGGIGYSVDLALLDIVQPTRYNAVLSKIQSFARYGVPSNAYAIVPIGAIDLTPSREALRFSIRTKTYLLDLFTRVSGMYVEAAYIDLAAAPDRKIALKRSRVWIAALNVTNSRYSSNNVDSHCMDKEKMLWNGEKVPSAITVGHTVIMFVGTSDRLKKERSTTIDLAAADSRTTYFSVHTEETPAEKIASDARSYLLSKDETLSDVNFLVLDNEPDSLWISENISFNRVEANNVSETAKEYRSARRLLGRSSESTASVVTEMTYPAFIIDANGKVTVDHTVALSHIVSGDLYIEANASVTIDRLFSRDRYQSDTSTIASFSALIKSADIKDKRVIYIGGTRTLAALLKRTGLTDNLTSLQDAMKDKWLSILDSLSELETKVVCARSEYSGVNQRVIDNLNYFAPVAGDILDKDFADLVNVVVSTENKRHILDTIEKFFISLKRANRYPDIAANDTTLGSLSERFPLLHLAELDLLRRSLSSPDNNVKIKHALLYINAAM